MDAFNFVASVIGLLLGFTLLELLKDFVSALKQRQRYRIGLLTPALAIVVIVDLLSWWVTMWEYRTIVVVTNFVLQFAFAASAIYYLAASYVFPDRAKDGSDLDDHYFAVRRLVLGAVLAINYVTIAVLWTAVGTARSLETIVVIGLVTLAFVVAMTSSSKRLNLAMLSLIFFNYVRGAFGL